MRFFYLILKITLQYSLRIFYKRIQLLNAPKDMYSRTIFVSNHANSFMDPLIVGGIQRPVVFFMTRSDVFTPISKPILWAAHMLPIYREHDGVDTKSKNEEVFYTCSKVLKYNRNLLIFGEGFTDDEFVRRLKPLKKGAARIGFNTLEKLDWKKEIYMATVGINYTDRNQIGSEILVSNSDKFLLNDYKDLYMENPNKAISEVTSRLEQSLKEQLTHLEKADRSQLHEGIMMINGKGMHPTSYDPKLKLSQRFKYSRQLANWFNEQQELSAALSALNLKLKEYQDLLKGKTFTDEDLYQLMHDQLPSKLGLSIKLILLAPFMLLGLLHCGPLYFVIKNFVEKSFKRSVFWGSVKLLLGMIGFGLINIPFIFLFAHFVFPSVILGFCYYALIGVFGWIAYHWFKWLRKLKTINDLKGNNHQEIILKRKALEDLVDQLIPTFDNR